MDKLTSAQAKVAANSVEIASNVAKKYMARYPKYADPIKSAAYWGVVKASMSTPPESFNERRNLAAMLAADAARKVVRSESRYKNAIARLQDSYTEIDTRDNFRKTEENDQIEFMVSVLPENYKRLFLLVYRDGLSLREAAIQIGDSRSSTRRMHANGLAILKQKLVA